MDVEGAPNRSPVCVFKRRALRGGGVVSHISAHSGTQLMGGVQRADRSPDPWQQSWQVGAAAARKKNVLNPYFHVLSVCVCNE